MEVIDGQSQGRRSWIATDMYESGAGSVGVVIEDIPIDPPIQGPHHCCHCCCHCTYRIPTLRELYQRDKRLLRAIVVITIVLNLPGAGKYVLYPFMIFSTWIHETFHGLAGKKCTHHGIGKFCHIMSHPYTHYDFHLFQLQLYPLGDRLHG